MKTHKYKLKNGIIMKSAFSRRNVPFDQLNAASVKRGPPKHIAEEGPLHYFGSITSKHSFYFTWDSKYEHIILHKTSKKPKSVIFKDAVKTKMCKIPPVPMKWVSAEEIEYSEDSKDNDSKNSKDKDSKNENVFGPTGHSFVHRKDVLNLPIIN